MLHRLGRVCRNKLQTFYDSRDAPSGARGKLRDTAYLDGLKAYAAFMVYIHHMTMRYYPDLPNWYGRTERDYQLIRLPMLRYTS